jgi:hypothetical protein
MVPAKKRPFPSQPAPVLREVVRFPDQPNVHTPTDEASTRMGDEGCPNESQSVEDATGYSREEEGS